MSMSPSFDTDEGFALQLDREDPLAPYRARFHLPVGRDGSPLIYFAGNSLGLQPKNARGVVEQELADWAALGVEGHFEAKRPWYRYHELLRESAGRLVGAKPEEVVMMNTLTVNLHLMMVTFYRPTATRYRILMEDTAFPSDTYAVKTQLACHGLDAADALLIARPRQGENAIRTGDVEALLAEEGESIALVMMSAVNYYTGQVFDAPRITEAARRKGCMVGFDLAHAAGNVPLKLHDWGVDFAAWCNYKYLNGGPGAVAGCFVHERHGCNTDLPRFGGWWGNDPDTRFRMHLEPEFVPRGGADGWQISNPPILSLAPVFASCELFDEVGMAALRDKSVRLSGYLRSLIERLCPDRLAVITPAGEDACGCQLSIRVKDRPEAMLDGLKRRGVVCDVRPPDVIRVAPVPLYNTFHEAWRFVRILASSDTA
ncbi:MAG: kynureninase [Phycisphaerae bacterium]